MHAKHESIYAILSINTGQLNLDWEKQIKLVFLELDDKRFERKTWCILQNLFQVKSTSSLISSCECFKLKVLIFKIYVHETPVFDIYQCVIWWILLRLYMKTGKLCIMFFCNWNLSVSRYHQNSPRYISSNKCWNQIHLIIEKPKHKKFKRRFCRYFHGIPIL